MTACSSSLPHGTAILNSGAPLTSVLLAGRCCCRLCWVLRLTPDLPALARLLCPALSSAVQLHLAGLTDRAPADMAQWKARRRPPTLSTQANIRWGRRWTGCAAHGWPSGVGQVSVTIQLDSKGRFLRKGLRSLQRRAAG